MDRVHELQQALEELTIAARSRATHAKEVGYVAVLSFPFFLFILVQQKYSQIFSFTGPLSNHRIVYFYVLCKM